MQTDALFPTAPASSSRLSYPPYLVLVVCVPAALAVAAAGHLMAAALGGILACVLVGAACHEPRRVLAAVVFVASLVPIEAAVKLGALPRVGPTRILLAAFYAGWLLHCLIHRNIPRIGWRPVGAALGVHLAVLALSTGGSIAYKTSLFAMAAQLAEQIGLLLAFCWCFRRPWGWPALRRALFAAALIVCLFGFAEALMRHNPMIGFYTGEEPIFRGGMLRIRATLFHPIALGCYLNLVWPFVLAGGLGPGIAGIRRWGHLGLVGVMWAALFLTLSRGPWVAALLQLGVFYGGLRLKPLTRFWVAGLGLGALCAATGLALLLFPGFSPARSEIINPSRLSLERWDEGSSEYYRIALLKAVRDHLEGPRNIYGLGPGTFHLAGIESEYAGHGHTLTAADSHYIRLFAESGLLGLGTFLLVALSAGAVSLRAVLAARGPDRQLAVAALAVVTGFLFENISVSMFPVFPLGALFWMAVAIGVELLRRSQAPVRA